MVNTDEGIKASWTTEEEDHVLMRYTLYEAAQVAEPRGIKIGLECHSQYSRTPDGLDRIYNLVKSPAIGHQSRHGQCLPGRAGPVCLAGTGVRSAGPSARQGHHRGPLGGRTGQGDRHARRLCLRRRSDRLEASHWYFATLSARHCDVH